MSAKRPNDGQEPNGIRAKSLSLAIPSESGRNPGYPRSPPPKKRQAEAKRHPGMDLSHAIPSKADRKPEAPAKAANRGEGGTEGKEGKEGKEEGGREREKGEGSQKAGKQKSGEAGKPGSREAGKPGSGRRHKKA